MRKVTLKRNPFLWILLFLLISSQIFTFSLQPTSAAGTTSIWIRSDGSIDPSSSPISSLDNVTYTLTGDLANSALIVERDNIIIDGAGYTLQGTGVVWSAGIDLSGRTNVTVKNARIDNFDYGIELRKSYNYNSISGNTITANNIGIWLISSSNNSISGNNMANNDIGIEFRDSSDTNIGGNTITASGIGIRLLQSCNNNILSRNTITANSGYGIFLQWSCNYNRISGNNITNSYYPGITIRDYCDYTSISGNTITANSHGIELLEYCSYNNVSGNTITANTYYGFNLEYCSNNIFTENNISECWTGFNFEDCNNNSLSGNNLRDVTNAAITMDRCSNLTLRLNSIVNATRSFEIWSEGPGSEMLSHYMHNVDASNTIDGKPVYYWTNQRDTTVPAAAGFVALINCTNVKVQDQNLSQSGTGLIVASTQNSTIKANKISGCTYGIQLISSSRNAIVDNELSSNSAYGIELTGNSTGNTIYSNEINANHDGIFLWDSDWNLIYGNEIQNSYAYHLGFHSSDFNLIYGNNFILTSMDVWGDGINTWDLGYPTGGNYWSRHIGSDADGDGIGDTPRVIDDFNQDNFPLMTPRMGQMAAPRAFFSYRIDYATGNVTFDASGSYDLLEGIEDFSWDFGDGQNATGMVVSHVYNFNSAQSIMMSAMTQANAEQDTYDATLTVTNDRGRSGSQTRKVGIGNVAIIGAAPLQVLVPDETLVHSEYTVFVIGYESTFNVSVSANVKLDAPGFKPNSSIIRNVVFSPGAQQLAFVKANMVPFDKPTVKVRVIFDPENAIGETNETDNTSNFMESSVNDTKPLRVLFVPVRFNNTDGYPGYFTGYSRQLFEEHGWESMKYLKATFPVADSEISYAMSCFNSAFTAGNKPTTKAEADATFSDLVSKLAERCAGVGYDRVVGVVRTDWFDGIPGWDTTLGYMYATSPTACVVTLGNWKTTVHELGHTYDLEHSNADQDGFYAIEKRVLNATQTWMATGAIASPPAKETYRVAVPGFWIRRIEYSSMVERMKLPGDPELLFFSATFYKSGTVKPDNWYRIPEGFPDYTEAETGNYSLVQLNSIGTVLSRVGFNVTFENVISEHPDHVVDEVPAAFTVPYAAGTKTIQIRNSAGTVVATKTVSTNAPTVQVTSPNGGEILTANHVQVSWTASDIDGDSLVYKLEVSGDGGATWDPVAAGLTQTTHDLILTGFKGGNKYLVKVVASDGVNTAEDLSNAYFTIASFSVSATSETETVQQGSKSYVLLNVTSYGGFSNPVALNIFCSAADQFTYRWVGASTINPRVNGYLMAVLEVTFNTTQTGVYTLYLSGSSGSNTEVAVVDFLVEPSEAGGDTTPPVTNAAYDGLWHTSDFTINLAATDSSGISATYYKINGGSTQSVSVNGQPRITVESGANTLEYWSLDGVGNEELPHKMLAQIKLDKTSPAGSIQINNGESYTTSTSVTLTLSATDAISGVSQVRYSNDGSTWGSWESASASKAWTLTSGDGAKTVYYQIKDNAGLMSSYSATITLQSPTPTPTPTPSPTSTPTATPTPTNPPAATPTPTPKPLASPTPSPVSTASPSPSPSPTASATPSPEPASTGFPVEYVFAIVGLVAAVIAVLAVLLLRKKK